MDQPIGRAVTVEATQQPIGKAAAIDMICQAHARQQQQMMVLQVNAIERSRKETIYRTLTDSGADTGGAYQKMLMATCNDRESNVGTCQEGGSLKAQGRGTMSFELLSGIQLDIEDAIYAKDLAHNVVGTTVLNKIGITAIFQNERTYLVEADSFQIPPTCTVLVDTQWIKKQDCRLWM